MQKQSDVFFRQIKLIIQHVCNRMIVDGKQNISCKDACPFCGRSCVHRTHRHHRVSLLLQKRIFLTRYVIVIRIIAQNGLQNAKKHCNPFCSFRVRFCVGRSCRPLSEAAYASTFSTSLPRYVPQFAQTLWRRINVPHFGHFVKAGASNFHTLERLLSRLAFETFFFGTAMPTYTSFIEPKAICTDLRFLLQ